MSVVCRPEGKLTPVLTQYWDIKEAFPDAILFFRMGDFYELFYHDAEIAASVLGLTLTARGKGSATETAMAGFPHHGLNNYLGKMVRQGYKVALCDQLEAPDKAQKIGLNGMSPELLPLAHWLKNSIWKVLSKIGLWLFMVKMENIPLWL